MKMVKLSEISNSIDYGVTASAAEEPVGPKFLRITDVQNNRVDWSSVPYCTASNGALKSSRLMEGDIVFARTGATTGKSFLIRNCPENAVFASYLIRVRPNSQVDPIFLSHFFDSPDYWRQISLKSAGAAQPGVNSSKLKDLEVPLPLLDEQKRIAAILDQADELRRLRQHAIDRLNELGQAIFIEMFGDPKVTNSHVKTVLISDICNISSGSTPRREDKRNYGGSIPWVKTGEVNGSIIYDTDEHVTHVGVKAARLKIYPINSIIIAMYGQGKTRGNVAYLGCPATTNQACAVLQVNSEANPRFVFEQLKILYDVIRSGGRGGNQPNLNSDIVGNISIKLPNLEAQKDYVEKIECIERVISREYKQHQRFCALFFSLQQRAFNGQL